MAGWSAWIGREEQSRDRITDSMVARWLATFDRDPPADGSVPQGLHWCLCLPDAPTAALGTDGHPQRSDRPDSFLPPVPLPRRMWASSQISFLTPLRKGDSVTRRSRIVSISEKRGASGPLVFVDIEHETAGSAGIAIRETQSLVYREAVTSEAPLSPPQVEPSVFDHGGWRHHRCLIPDERLLFRFSALTFNGHRIHYDLPYARDVERYRGLIVHGPLTATLLLDLVRREHGDNALSSFSFRGLSPAICGEPLHLVMRTVGADMELAAFADDGRQVATARAREGLR